MTRAIAFSSRHLVWVGVLLFGVSGLHAEENLSVEVQMRRTVFQAGSPIKLYIKYTNSGKNGLLLPQDYENPGIVLLDASTKQPVHRYGEGKFFRLTGRAMGLNPGRPLTETIDLARYFVLKSPDEYIVHVEKRYGPNNQKAESNTITFRLTP